MDVHGSAPETLLRWHEKISPPMTELGQNPTACLGAHVRFCRV